MSHNKRFVLTRDEIKELIGNSVFRDYHAARRIEQAVLLKLREASEPVAEIDRGCIGNLKWTPSGVLHAVRLPNGTKLYAEPRVSEARPTDDALWDQTLAERDDYHDWADELSQAIAAHLGIDIGEHSSSNLPWLRALDAIKNAALQTGTEVRYLYGVDLSRDGIADVRNAALEEAAVLADKCNIGSRFVGNAIRALKSAPTVEAFDFLAHLARQREWSERTFGPGSRAKGVVDHIRKELIEIESDPDDLREWVDVIILALDGAWRSGATSQQIIDAIVAKQTKNEGRVWPDWRTMDPNKAIEHDRTQDAPAAETPANGVEDVALPPIKVGALPTMNQDEYPGLGDWWVQLRTGPGNGEVLARVYGDSPEQAVARAKALADRQQLGGDVSLAVEALRAAQNNLAARRPLGSSDPQSPDYDHDAFMWDYYQRAIDAALASQKPVKE